MTNPTEMRRNRECLHCEEQWSSPVRLSEHTANLSGEATEFCPKCGSRSVVSSAAYDPETYDGTF